MLKSRHSGLLQVSLLLGVGIAIIYWKVLFLGYVQVPADIPPYFDPVMREITAEEVLPENPLLSDHVNQFYVWHYLAAKSMQNEGKIPLWNPYMLAGQALMANAQPALFYPPNLLLFWLDPGVVTSIRAIFNLFVAGIFTYLFCRTLRISALGAMLAAVGFSFSGALIVGPSHAYANSLAWLPFTMWAGEKAFGQSRTSFWAVVASIGIALSMLGGHPESSFHNLLIFSLYVAVRLLCLTASPGRKLRLAGLFAVALVLGFALGAIQWVPFLAWWRESSTITRSAAWGADSIFYFRDWLPNLATLVTLLFPGFYGHPADYTYQWPFATFQNFLEQSMYFGLMATALAVESIVAIRRNRQITLIIIAVLALLSLGVALRLPGLDVFNHLPIFVRVNNTRLKWYFSFLGAVLGGFGLDHFVTSVAADQGTRRRATSPAIVVLAMALVIVLAIVAAKYIRPAASAIPAGGFLHHLLFEVFSWNRHRTTISLLVLVLGIAALTWAIRQRRGTRITIVRRMIVALTFVELVVLAYGYNTLLPREKVFPAVRLTEMLQRDPDLFRIMSIPPAFWPNYGGVYGLFHVGGYDLPVFKRYSDVYEAQGGNGYRQVWSPDWALADWMNVKYIITTQEYNLEKLELVFEDTYRVYKNTHAMPRAYMVYDTQVMADEQELLELMTSGAFPFEQTVLLEEPLPPEEEREVAAPAAEPGSVSFVHFGNDKVVLQVDTPTAGVLVMSDVFAPGWLVAVDERPVTLHRANYAFRAVFVPTGSHRVVFTYRPPDFLIGSYLSALGLLVLVIGLPVLWAVERPHSRIHKPGQQSVM